MKYSEPALRASESTLIQVAMLADRVDATHRLYYGEPDLPTPDFICEAATEAMKAGHLYYTPTAGYAELKEAIADHINQLHAVRYKPSEVVTTVGAGMAIFLVIAASVEPGDNVVIVAPAFSVFASTVQLFDGEVRQVPLALDGDRFRLDMEALQAAVDDRTKLVVVNSPSNPTGWVITEQEQRSLWALVVERDILLVSDEVYERIVFDSAVAPSFSRIATDREHLLLINSFSKTYNMTGWRLGYALGDERLIGLMAKVEEFIISSPPAMIQQAGIAALRHGEDTYSECRSSTGRGGTSFLESSVGCPGSRSLNLTERSTSFRRWRAWKTLWASPDVSWRRLESGLRPAARSVPTERATSGSALRTRPSAWTKRSTCSRSSC